MSSMTPSSSLLVDVFTVASALGLQTTLTVVQFVSANALTLLTPAGIHMFSVSHFVHHDFIFPLSSEDIGDVSSASHPTGFVEVLKSYHELTETDKLIQTEFKGRHLRNCIRS